MILSSTIFVTFFDRVPLTQHARCSLKLCYLKLYQYDLRDLSHVDASTHLYKRVCPSICPTTSLSICHAFSKNPRNCLFLVAYDIRKNTRTSRNPFSTHTHTQTHKHTHTYAHVHACAFTQHAAKVMKKPPPDANEEELQKEHNCTNVLPKLTR